MPLALVVARLIPAGKGQSPSGAPKPDRKRRRHRRHLREEINKDHDTRHPGELLQPRRVLGGGLLGAYVPGDGEGLSLSAMADFSLFMYAGMFAGFQLFGVMADKVGRRPAMMAAFLLVSLSVAVFIVSRNTAFSVSLGRGGGRRRERRCGGRGRILRGAFSRRPARLRGRFLLERGAHRRRTRPLYDRLYRQGPRPHDGPRHHVRNQSHGRRRSLFSAGDAGTGPQEEATPFCGVNTITGPGPIKIMPPQSRKPSFYGPFCPFFVDTLHKLK